jgi:hypothetical protein
MTTQKTNSRPSVLKGEAKFESDERTKKAFAESFKKNKKRQGDFSQTIICGPEEFAETEKKKPKN